MNKFVGFHADAHVVSDAPELAHRLGADAFAFNLIDPVRRSSKPYDQADIDLFRARCEEYGYVADKCILPHSAFTVNLGSPDARKLNLSRITFVDELRRAASLGVTRLNFHPGSHLKQMGEQECLDTIAQSVNYALARTEGVTAVLENTAGSGSAVGYSFAQLAYIISRVEDKSRVGVCVDTCHAMAAGYDLGTAEGYDACWREFGDTVGWQYLRGMHLNDAMRPAGSRIDRHAPIGKGTIGSDAFARIMRDHRFDNIPLILETPDASLWTIEMDWLRAACTDSI